MFPTTYSVIDSRYSFMVVNFLKVQYIINKFFDMYNWMENKIGDFWHDDAFKISNLIQNL
jgi:hypothetical protein